MSITRVKRWTYSPSKIGDFLYWAAGHVSTGFLVGLGLLLLGALVAIFFATTDVVQDVARDLWVNVTSETTVEVKVDGRIEELLEELLEEMRK